MGYYFTNKMDVPCDEAIIRVIDELKKDSFGILTDIDVKATLQKVIENL